MPHLAGVVEQRDKAWAALQRTEQGVSRLGSFVQAGSFRGQQQRQVGATESSRFT